MPVPDTSLDMTFDADQCDGFTVVVLMEEEAIIDWLPAGFHPRDAQGLFDLGVGTGRVPVFVAGAHCAEPVEQSLQFGFAGIFVEAPPWSGSAPGREPSNFHLYSPMHYGLDDPVADVWNKTGWPVSGVPVEVTVLEEAVPSGTVGAVAPRGLVAAGTGDNDPDGFFIGVDGFVPIAEDLPTIGFEDWSLRVWTTNEHGTGFTQFDFTETVWGGGGYCILHPDSLVARLLDSTFCGARLDADPEQNPSRETVGAAFPGTRLDARIVWMPGEFVA